MQALDAAAAAGGGVAWLPSNGTYLMGGGVHLLGHSYDHVTLKVSTPEGQGVCCVASASTSFTTIYIYARGLLGCIC